jgi:hypothetical protein
MFLPGRDPRGPNRGLPRVRAVEVVVVASLFSCPMEELSSAWDAAARRGAPPRRPGQRMRRRGELHPCGLGVWLAAELPAAASSGVELASELPAPTASHTDLTTELPATASSGAELAVELPTAAGKRMGWKARQRKTKMVACWSAGAEVRR